MHLANLTDSTGFSVLVGILPFLFFFLCLAFQLMSSRQQDIPKIATHKLVAGLSALSILSIFLLLLLLTPPTHVVPPKVIKAVPPTLALPAAPKVNDPLRVTH